MNSRPRILVIIVGCVTTLAAAFGLYYSARSVFFALRGGFSDPAAGKNLAYFFPAFYIMSGICMLCNVLLLVFGFDLLRVRLRWSSYFVGVLLFEVVYFFFIGTFWLVPGVGMSIAAATGVANGGLMAQFIILLPLWVPLVLRWARRELEHDEPVP